MTKLDLDTVTETHIIALRNEAVAAGDFEQVELCNLALAEIERPWEGTECRKACVDAINEARAQQ